MINCKKITEECDSCGAKVYCDLWKGFVQGRTAERKSGLSQEELRRAKKEARLEAIDECIKVMKYCWHNGQQPLNVLVGRLEKLKGEQWVI